MSNLLTIKQIALETELSEVELTRLSYMGIFYVLYIGGLIRVPDDEYQYLKNYIKREGVKKQNFGKPLISRS